MQKLVISYLIQLSLQALSGIIALSVHYAKTKRKSLISFGCHELSIIDILNK